MATLDDIFGALLRPGAIRGAASAPDIQSNLAATYGQLASGYADHYGGPATVAPEQKDPASEPWAQWDSDPEIRAKQLKAAQAVNEIDVHKKKKAEQGAGERATAAAISTPPEQFRGLDLPMGRSYQSQVGALGLYGALNAPSTIKTATDDQGNMTLTGSMNEMGGLLGQIRQWQAKSQMLDQQLAQRDAQLEQQAMQARANPLVHALGMLSANIASQPQMPGFVRALGQTAAQMHAENDPAYIQKQRDEILAKRMGLYKEDIGLATGVENAETQRVYRQNMIEDMQEKRRLQAAGRALNAVKNVPAGGGYSPEYFKGLHPEISDQEAKEYSDQSFATGKAKQAITGIKELHEQTYKTRVGLVEEDINRKWEQGNARIKQAQAVIDKKATTPGGVMDMKQLRLIGNDISRDAKAMQDGINRANAETTSIKKKLADLAEKVNPIASDAEKQEATTRRQALETDLKTWDQRKEDYAAKARALQGVADRVATLRADALTTQPAVAAPAAPPGTASPAVAPAPAWNPQFIAPLGARLGPSKK